MVGGLNSNPNPNNSVERLELIILETKAGHDEMLNIYKKLLSINIFNQEQLDNFVFNYGKKIMVEKQQLLAKEVFSPQITKFRTARIIPLYKDQTWSAGLTYKSSLSKYNNNCKFKLMVIDIFTKYACVIPSKKKSGLSITNGFKIVLGETELYYTYSNLRAVFIEILNRNLLRIIKKPMFINGDRNWVNILNDAVVTYNNNIHSTNMTSVNASNNPDKFEYTFGFKKIKPNHKVGDYVRIADKRNIFSKGYTSNWNRELFKVNEVLKTQPPTYKIEEINGEIIEAKYYEQELLKPEFDFESNRKVLESLKTNLSVNKYKDDKKWIKSG